MIYKNKNKKKDATIALARPAGVDVAANIAKFFPGTGGIVSASRSSLETALSAAESLWEARPLSIGKSVFGTCQIEGEQEGIAE